MSASVALITILGLAVSFGLPLALVALILVFKHRKLRMTHETIARLAEKGLPVPPELIEPRRRGGATMRGALILIGLGIALGVFFEQVGGPWSIGLIPGLMGGALLLALAIEKRTAS